MRWRLPRLVGLLTATPRLPLIDGLAFTKWVTLAQLLAALLLSSDFQEPCGSKTCGCASAQEDAGAFACEVLHFAKDLPRIALLERLSEALNLVSTLLECGSNPLRSAFIELAGSPLHG